jgi:ATP-dependent Clp protease protease subunit
MDFGKEFLKYAKGHLRMGTLGLESYINNSLTPYVLEERQLNMAQIDVFSRLMADRIIFLGTPIDDYIGNVITAQLLFLESADSKKDILLYVNSPGGSVYAGLGIYDTMQYVRPDIQTICTGMAASMGAVLLTAGQKGKRASLPHARIMIHQPSGGAQGQASEIEIMYKEMRKTQEELYNILATHSGQSYEKIEKDSDRDYWMRAHEAKEYGLVDEVLERK